VQLLARFDANQRLDLVQAELDERLEVLNLGTQVPIVLAVDAGQTPQNVLRREVEPGFAFDASQRRRLVLVESDLLRRRRIGFRALFLQVAKDLDRLIGRRGPDDAEFRERNGQEDELGAEVEIGRRSRRFGLDIGLWAIQVFMSGQLCSRGRQPDAPRG
jgi:hypothetical protein